jgi:hypothetical protein
MSFLLHLGLIVICHYGLQQHLTLPMSFKFILSLGFDQCYMSLGLVLIKRVSLSLFQVYVT